MAVVTLVKYDAACKALAAAKAVDEVKKIRDVAEATRLYARQAKNKSLEVDAAEIRFRAERRLGEMLAAQPLSKGGDPTKAKPSRKGTGSKKEPVPTLKELGLGKKLSSRAQKLAAVPEKKFERTIADWRERVSNETERVTTNLVREGERAQRETALKKSAKPLPAGVYTVLYCDPPWRYEYTKTENRAIENKYPTMALADICAVNVPSAEDCVLFLWATSPKLADAIDVIEAWGFSYRTCAVWVKDKIGMGYYFRQQHELLLIATKGSPGVPEPSVRSSSVIESRRDKHSKKPDSVYGLIERMYPKARRCELWAREKHPKWDSWGYEV